MNVSERATLSDFTLIGRMEKVRDDRIEELIREKRIADDPISDAASMRVLPSRGRENMAAHVPEVNEITMPTFIDSGGEVVQPYATKVASAPRRGSTLKMELSIENPLVARDCCQCKLGQFAEEAQPHRLV